MFVNPFFKIPENHDPLTAHIFSVPHNPSHKGFPCCAFSQKALDLYWMLKSVGFNVRHYGNELSVDVENPEMGIHPDDHVTVTTAEQLMDAYPNCKEQLGHVDYLNPENPEAIKYLNDIYALNTAYEVKRRHQQGDFLCYVVPTIQKELYQNLVSLPVHHIETGVGYMGAYLPYRIFESPAIQAWHYGYYASNFEKHDRAGKVVQAATPAVPLPVPDVPDSFQKAYEGVFPFDPNTHIAVYEVPKLDAVIPNSFDVSQFDFRIKKKDYLLYLGRITPQKGIGTAIAIAEKVGMKLIIAGPGDFEKEMGFKPPPHVEIVGPVGPEERRTLLAFAFALLCPSDYWEPFGGIHIEAMLSGTVPVASDKGGFQNTIRSGWNGYRIAMNSVEQGVWAVKNVDKISPYVLRDFGLRFSKEQIALRYNEYFQSLSSAIHHNGDLNSIENLDRENLDWIDYDRKIQWPEGWMTPVDKE